MPCSEIVTPSAAYRTRSIRSLPGHRGRAGRPAAPRPAAVDARASASCASARAGQEESFAIAGGFLQVRPDKVVVMAETADLAAEIDLETAQEARREAERALEGGLRGAGRPGRRPGRSSSRRCCASASPSAATARVRGSAAAMSRAMADARPFHWEYQPEPVAARGLPRRGRPAAERHGARSAAPRTPRSSCSPRRR